MTTFWPEKNGTGVPAGDAPSPRLHAFIVGVSRYRHLPGGVGAPARNQMALAQLTSPQHSALAIKDWLLSTYAKRHAGVPLGSVEIALSPLEPMLAGQAQMSDATMTGIRASFNAWYARCNSHDDNIALFYFCGHGIAKDNQYLLAEDFGSPDLANSWANCINFDAFRMGMRSCKASKQIFFVDACRQVPDNILSAISPSGECLLSADYRDRPPVSATYYATSTGTSAYGKPNAPSFFCDALIRCLNGLGAVSTSEGWTVNTYTLASALGQVLPVDQLRHRVPLRCNPNIDGDSVPLVTADRGRVLVCIRCLNDPSADAIAHIELVDADGDVFSARPLSTKPLFDEVAAGNAMVTVKFGLGGHGFADLSRRFTLMPPVFSGLNVPTMAPTGP